MADQAKRRVTLASVVGIAAATVILTMIPREESGRTVRVSIDPKTTEATITHLAGPQYLRVYLDIAGVKTACDGLTKGMKLGQRLSEQQCTTMLNDELVDSAGHIRSCVPQLFDGRHPNQLAASVVLAHNIGWPSFCSSTASKLFRALRWRAACDAFLPWNKATKGGRKVFVQGLADRRGRERALCLTGL